jgi:hypothetical protein
MAQIVRLLFTKHDLGHSFDDYQAPDLIEKVVTRKWNYLEDFATGSIGHSASERTVDSDIPRLYANWKYVYIIDARTYTIVHAIVDVLPKKGKKS